MKITRRLRIRGQVQGVNLREAMRQRADQLKITGWVQNRLDGSVEAIVQGEAFAIDAIVEWAHQGPPGARVDSLDVETADDEGNYDSFDKKSTA
ncbi:MAG TPA: acylphosphatase [Burkholderiales bacterium]|jgi:acylphosphatase|nr:acylphosphatase [Burkholderiales bacterium]